MSLLSNTDFDYVVAFNVKNGPDCTRFHVNLDTSLKSHPGSVPQSVALSPDGARLFVACAALDAVAVVRHSTDSDREVISHRFHSHRVVSQRPRHRRQRPAHRDRQGRGQRTEQHEGQGADRALPSR